MVAVGLVGAGAGPVLAERGTPASRNAAATRAYLSAEARGRQAISRGNSRRAAAAQALLMEVQNECPDVLAGAGQGGEFRPDVVSLLAYARRLSMRPAYLRFARETARLLWSSRELTRDVHRKAKAIAAEVNIVQPHLCAEARAYVASGYQMAPTGTRRFIAESEAIENEFPLPRRLNALLLPYERAAGLTPPPNTPPATVQSRADERAFFNEFEQLFKDLGLPEK